MLLSLSDVRKKNTHNTYLLYLNLHHCSCIALYILIIIIASKMFQELELFALQLLQLLLIFILHEDFAKRVHYHAHVSPLTVQYHLVLHHPRYVACMIMYLFCKIGYIIHDYHDIHDFSSLVETAAMVTTQLLERPMQYYITR